MENENDSQKQKGAAHKGAPSDVPLKILATKPAEHPAENKFKEWLKGQWGKPINWPHILQAAGIVIAALVALIYGKQLQVMEGQLREMQSSAPQTFHLIVNAANQTNATKLVADRALVQASATNDLAQQAKRSAHTAEQALAASIDANRPWIGTIITAGSLEIDKVASITASHTNTGKRPALVISARLKAAEYQYFPEKPEYEETRLSRSVLVPGHTAYAAPTDVSKIDALLIKHLENSTTRFYIHTEVVYLDIGGDHPTVEHYTRECVVYYPSMKKFLNCDNPYAGAN